jgi:glycosyltransferase involved in cell wall biosynthesis
MLHILQVTPAYFAESSIVSGGERYVSNVCAAVATADSAGEMTCDMLSFGARVQSLALGPRSRMVIAAGNPARCVSCAGPALDDILARYEVVHVHQCLTSWGIFVAARARLAGALVLGSDEGGGEAPGLESCPVLTDVFDLFHALSDFAASAFFGLPVPCHVIAGPVDESLFPLEESPRDPAQMLALGRILPHKGFERAIAALPEGARLTIVGRNYDHAYLAFLKDRAQG